MPNSWPFSRSGLFLRSVVGMLIIAVLLAGAFSTSVARADGDAGQPTFGLQPVLYDPSQPATKSYFIFDAHPGAILHNGIRVTNNGTATGTVGLYAVDSATGQTSGTVYLSHDAVQHDVGTWITLGMQHVTLAPGESQVVPMQVTVPATMWPGQHVGGIVAENVVSEKPSNKGTLHIQVRNLTIIAVQVNLPGSQIEQLTATGIQAGGANNYQTLLVGLDNSGTTMLKPTGSLQITDAYGHLLQNQSIKLDTFLPHTTITYPVYVKDHALGAGNYRATLTMTYGHGHVLNYTAAFTITEQQVAQVFKAPAPLQAPEDMKSVVDTLPIWQIITGGLLLLVVGGMCFWGQKRYSLAKASQRRRKRQK
ncbi:MAG: DUF916 and DUF3324 domain-containing protein [Chloroflexota bacterium]|nr:DUF916 and DUF3324 domain-containing protein [Chloroflexota bacterium]